MKKERKEYQRPSIQVVEAEAQQPIASSNVSGLNADSWGSDSGDGTIVDN